MNDLIERLPALLPMVIDWAERRSGEIAEQGTILSPERQGIARQVGVEYPERIRVCLVETIPFPEDPILRAAAEQVGMFGPGIAGLTLGYGIYIASSRDTDRLIAHECRHVQQFERLGSLAMFLTAYLTEVAVHGYEHAPMEQEARKHE